MIYSKERFGFDYVETRHPAGFPGIFILRMDLSDLENIAINTQRDLRSRRSYLNLVGIEAFCKQARVYPPENFPPVHFARRFYE